MVAGKDELAFLLWQLGEAIAEGGIEPAGDSGSVSPSAARMSTSSEPKTWRSRELSRRAAFTWKNAIGRPMA